MKSITCITPTVEGREMLLERCKRYVERFDVDCEHKIVSSDNMHQNVLELLTSVKTDLVAFIEDDDWYHPDYLKIMVDKLEFSGRYLIGIDPTIYYHLWHQGYRILPHPCRASLFTTLGYTDIIRRAAMPILTSNSRGYIDISLWQNVVKPRFLGITSVEKLAVGIKHNFGKCEGNGHTFPKEYWVPDPDWSYLESIIGDDVEDYKKLKEEILKIV